MALQFAVSYAGGERLFIRARRWPFRIGRDPRNDLCLAESDKVSRVHARVVSQDGTPYLIVSGSNPTFLNGTRVSINEPHELQIGDVIELPDYRLEVQDSSGPDEPAASTVVLKAITENHGLIRLIATRLALTRWTAEGIHQWLQAGRDREIMITVGHYQLCLQQRLDLETLTRRIDLFSQLQDEGGLAETRIDIADENGPIS